RHNSSLLRRSFPHFLYTHIYTRLNSKKSVNFLEISTLASCEMKYRRSNWRKWTILQGDNPYACQVVRMCIRIRVQQRSCGMLNTFSYKYCMNLLQAEVAKRLAGDSGDEIPFDDGRPCAAMELCLGGRLFDLLQDKYRQEKTVTCREAALVIYKIGIALLFCHENHIVHLDVKPANILFRHREDLSSACLSYFGLSYALFQTEAVVLGQKNGVSVEYINAKLFEGRGTEGYSAPELMNGGFLSKAADIWSLGATLLEMLTGEEVPVHSVAISEWWAKDAATKLEQELSNRVNGWKELDWTAQDLILAMLCPDFMARLPLTHVLIHPWLLNNLFHAPPGQEDACTDASTTPHPPLRTQEIEQETNSCKLKSSRMHTYFI
ncbi:hypothetical protein KP509_39G014800, partial [Ceratopteris richardii]